MVVKGLSSCICKAGQAPCGEVLLVADAVNVARQRAGDSGRGRVARDAVDELVRKVVKGKQTLGRECRGERLGLLCECRLERRLAQALRAEDRVAQRGLHDAHHADERAPGRFFHAERGEHHAALAFPGDGGQIGCKQPDCFVVGDGLLLPGRLEREARAAAAHGLQKRVRLFRGQDEKREVRRLFKLLEQRVLRVGVHIVRMADDGHAARAVVRDDGVFRLDTPRKIDLELVFTFVDEGKVGMHAVLHLAAGKAGAAGARPIRLAQDTGGECGRERFQTAAVVSREQNGLRHAAGERAPQARLQAAVAGEGVKGDHSFSKRSTPSTNTVAPPTSTCTGADGKKPMPSSAVVGMICLRVEECSRMMSKHSSRRLSSRPTRMVTLPALRKPPVVASLVMEKPAFIRLLITSCASS